MDQNQEVIIDELVTLLARNLGAEPVGDSKLGMTPKALRLFAEEVIKRLGVCYVIYDDRHDPKTEDSFKYSLALIDGHYGMVSDYDRVLRFADRYSAQAMANLYTQQSGCKTRVEILMYQTPYYKADDPDTDGTDWCHPAWWRGHHDTFLMMVDRINEVLDGKGIEGSTNEPWATARARIHALVARSEGTQDPAVEPWRSMLYLLDHTEGAVRIMDADYVGGENLLGSLMSTWAKKIEDYREEIDTGTARTQEQTYWLMRLIGGHGVLLSDIRAMTPEQIREMEEWAVAVHLSANDNEDVSVPPRPEFVPYPNTCSVLQFFDHQTGRLLHDTRWMEESSFHRGDPVGITVDGVNELRNIEYISVEMPGEPADPVYAEMSGPPPVPTEVKVFLKARS